MKPGSPVLAMLAGSAQPPIPYVAIAGDQPFGPGGDGAGAKRILAKLASAALVETLFDSGPHDLAVSVKSATTFGSAWTTLPPNARAHCNHLTYFASEDGLAAVRRALAPPAGGR
jgi:hypothetical protein